MKIVEKLVNNYLSLSAFPVTDNYLSAMRILCLTEESNSILLEKMLFLRDNISPKLPISISKAESFLNSSYSKLELNTPNGYIMINKNTGGDYQLKQLLFIVVQQINTYVVESISKYNTNRSFLTNIPEDEEL